MGFREQYTRVSTEPHVYTWSMSGELLGSVPLAEFTAAHDLDARDLFARLLLVQAVVGREPEPLVLATGAGDMLLTLTPRLRALSALNLYALGSLGCCVCQSAGVG